ncbi:uncharacterized protein METZ01_LOCUS182970, partial [marine metagenome]
MMRIRSIIQYAFFLAFLSGSMIYAVTASFSTDEDEADEDETCQVTIEFDAPAWGSVTYDVSGTSTATAYGAGGYYDYNLSSNTLDFTGEESYTLNLNVYNDNRYEEDETIVLNLVSGNNITIGSPSTITFTIDSEDAPPTVEWRASSSSQTEGQNRAIYVDVDEDGSDVGETATIDWTITNVSASSSDHAVSTSGQFTFTEMNSYKYFNYRADGDGLDENNETFTIALSSNTNCSLGGGSPHQHTILDPDDPPNVAFSVSGNTYAESQGNIAVTVDLDAASGKDDITVNYAIDPSSTADTDDHTLTAGVLTYAEGDQSESFSFNIEDDGLDESDTEDLVIYLTGNNENDLTIGEIGTHTITITDIDGMPTVSIGTTGSDPESVTSPEVTVTLSELSGRDVSLSYADKTAEVAPDNAATEDDYTFTDGNLTISAGSLTNTFSFTVVDDNLNEEDQKIIYSIASPDYATLANSQQEYTITNTAGDDPEPYCGFSSGSSNVDEGSDGTTTHSVSVVLKDSDGNSITSEKDITFNYAINAADGGTAAGSGTDYTLAAASTTIEAGESDIDIDVTIVGDALYENNETIIIALDPDNGG